MLSGFTDHRCDLAECACGLRAVDAGRLPPGRGSDATPDGRRVVPVDCVPGRL